MTTEDVPVFAYKAATFEAGIQPVRPDSRDYSLLHSLGLVQPWYKRLFSRGLSINKVGVVNRGLPKVFSIYDGRPIPDQNEVDERFMPPVRPLPMGCTGETQTFGAGLSDGQTYRPDDFYDNTPPYRNTEGRDMRMSMQTAINRGFTTSPNIAPDNKRRAYFNCYGAGDIDDFDAAKIGLWVTQQEKRSVSVALWWYWGYRVPTNGIVTPPSFDISRGTLHNVLITGWLDIDGEEYLECIPWIGMRTGKRGLCYISRPFYNALMAQPHTAALVMTKLKGDEAVPLGYQVYIDHFVYWFRTKFKV